MNKRYLFVSSFTAVILLFVLLGSVMVYGADAPIDPGTVAIEDSSFRTEKADGGPEGLKALKESEKSILAPAAPREGESGSTSKDATDDIPGVQIPGSSIIGGYLNSYYNHVDVYRVNLIAGQTIMASLNSPAGADFDIFLLDSSSVSLNGTYHIIGGSISTSNPDEFAVAAPYTGVYYLVVHAYSGSGNYVFGWGLDNSPDHNIPGVPLPQTQPIGGSLSNLDIDDVYYVYLADGQTINISLSAYGSNDFDMYLYKWGATNVGSSYGLVAGSNHTYYPESISYTVPPGGGGYYFLDLYSFRGAGNYVFAYSIVNHNPVGTVDGVSSVGPNLINVRGWTFDPDSASAIAVHYYADGVPLGTATANLARGDIGAAYPAYGANHGYSTNLTLAPGPHNVCAYGINTGTGSNASLGCRYINVAVNPVGNLDWASRAGIWGTASGWAIDPDTTAAVAIHLYSDGRLIGPQPANLYANLTRGDIGARFPAYGANHGFYVFGGMSSLPHNLCVYAINQGPGVNTLIGCRVI